MSKRENNHPKLKATGNASNNQIQSMAKVMLGKMTVADASEKSGLSVEELLTKLDELVQAHKPKSSW